MRTLTTVMLFLTVFAFCEAVAQPYCKTGKTCIALVIGNNQYAPHFPNLGTPAEDAEVVRATLSDLGFDAKLLVNATRDQINASFDQFAQQVPVADVYFFYYSGIGGTLANENQNAYIVPSGTPRYGNAVRAALIPIDSFIETLRDQQSESAVGVFVFDSGRTELDAAISKSSNLLSKGFGRSSFSPSEKEFYTFFASAAASDAQDSGLFAKLLATELQSEGDIVRVFGRTREKVMLATRLGQIPELEVDGLKGRPFCLVGCSAGNSNVDDYSLQIAAQAQGECSGEWVRPASGEPRYALVIGNNGYSHENWRRLTQPSKDADMIYGALEKVSFSTIKCYNLPREKLKKKVDEFRAFLEAEVKHWEANDGKQETKPSGFFYFSGHGASRADRSGVQDYMIPTNSTAKTSADLIDQAVNLTALTRDLEGVDANAIFVVFDACRNELDAKAPTNEADFKARVVRRSGMLIAYATSMNTKARESSGYAESLAKYITRSGERASAAFEDAGIDIARQSNGEQIPEMQYALKSAYRFVN